MTELSAFADHVRVTDYKFRSQWLQPVSLMAEC
jgi:hypothetical protein